jgi:general secretion pathway protein F
MPVYQYIGIDQKGKRSGGMIDADSERAARFKLRRMGVFPTSLAPKGSAAAPQKMSLNMQIDFSKYLQRVKVQDVALMTRQLSSLLNAGIPLVDALGALIEQIENVKLRTVLSEVREEVVAGAKMSDAMKKHPSIFNHLYVNMVNAGESSGTLDVVLVRLADFTEGQAKLRSKIIGAMIYPAIMTFVGIALMAMLLVYVVPKVTKIFEDVNAALPLPTRVLMSVSNALKDYWYLFLLMIPVIVFAVKRFLKTPKGRAWWDKKSLKMPLFGNLQRMVVVSRFARTLATLLSSGVPLMVSMDIVRNIVTNVHLRKVVEETRDNVREGQSMADPLKRSGEFPPIVTHMIAVGEKTGELEKMLERVADNYDTQVDTTVSTLTTLLEPVMILVMAAIVAFIVLSILLPILKLNQLGM